MKYWFHKLLYGLVILGLVGVNATHAQISHQNQSSQVVVFGVEKISEFMSNQINKDLGLYSYATHGNQAHSGIERDWINSGSSDVRLERCAWLAKNKHNYSAEAVKATEKAWGCRHSRVSKDKKKK